MWWTNANANEAQKKKMSREVLTAHIAELLRFRDNLNRSLKGENTRIRNQPRDGRTTSSPYQATATKVKGENHVLRSKTRKLETDPERSEEERKKENEYHTEELERKNDEHEWGSLGLGEVPMILTILKNIFIYL
ncbi:hypothetical protein OEA41_003432 [Lepraria neglecta]|uniref:Uncharacterized protein n=1 Tax=Lepraria neglecta TaxID=209136 RepID=A0AAD9Z5Y3_9LECA|nr:hypothetical protein OEA41_003432 [Lepraria neglecta]